MRKSTHNPHEQRDLPEAVHPDLRTVAEWLDRAGASDRAAAPRGLEQRVFDSTRPVLVESTGVVGHLRTGRWINGARFRMAAGIAVAALGVVAAGWLISKPSTPVSAPGAEPVTVLANRLEADLLAWQSERSSVALTNADAQLLNLSRALDTLESGGTVDPWADFDDAAPEPSL